MLLCIAHAQPTRIYIANDDHTDYFWTADDATYEAVFVDMIDYYLDLCDTTATNAAPYQNRFNLDGSYWLWTYEKKRTPQQFARLMARIKDGHFSAPITALTSCYGGQPAEAVLRGMYYAGQLERRFDCRFKMAICMENQTLPLGLASLWAGAGARYSWRGVCDCATRLPGQFRARPHEIYWYAGKDDQRILMKWNSLAPSGNQSLGGYAEAYDPVGAINYLSTNAAFLSRYTDASLTGPYRIRSAFGFGWDALSRKTGVTNTGYPYSDHFHNIAREQSDSTRQVIVSNEEDFFADFEAVYGASLPADSETTGNEWDLYSASMAETSARVRRAVEKLRAAEAMATLVALANPSFTESYNTARDQAFIDLGLYWEHDWTADGPVSRSTRARWQVQLADQIEAYVNSLYAGAASQLAGLISNRSSQPRFVVFNPLGWSRTSAADLLYAGSTNIHITDLSGNEAPHQINQRQGAQYLRLLASDLPSLGYKVYEIRTGPGKNLFSPAAVASNTNSTFDNGWIKLSLQPSGAITSLVDKTQTNTEFAAAIGGLKLNDFAANDLSGEAITVENEGPVSVTLKCVSAAGKKHTTRVTLFRDSPSVDIENEIQEGFPDVRHWGFSFNLEAPITRTEEVGAIINVKTKSQGGDYADAAARYDYFTLNHFADITDGANTRGITLANADCAFARLSASTVAHLDTSTPQINVLAGGQVDGLALGITNQFGNTRFVQRFSLHPHRAYDATAAMKFALEMQNPPAAAMLSNNAAATYPEASYSLIALDDSDVLLWALKPHHDGIAKGVVARTWNLAQTPKHAGFVTTPKLSLIFRTTHLETDLHEKAEAAQKLDFSPQQLSTFRLMLK